MANNTIKSSTVHCCCLPQTQSTIGNLENLNFWIQVTLDKWKKNAHNLNLCTRKKQTPTNLSFVRFSSKRLNRIRINIATQIRPKNPKNPNPKNTHPSLSNAVKHASMANNIGSSTNFVISIAIACVRLQIENICSPRLLCRGSMI